MEAGEVTEEPHTSSDAEEHPSPKDPAAEDLQEPQPSEVPVESSISETPLEPHSPMSPLEPHSPMSPLEPHRPMSPLEPSGSNSPLGTHTSETPLEHSASGSLLEANSSQTPLEVNTSESLLAVYPTKIPLKQDPSGTPSKTSLSGASVGSLGSKDLVFRLSASSSKDDAQGEALHSEPSSSEVPQSKMPALEAPDVPLKPSLSGHSAQVHKDSAAGQKEEAEKGKEGAAVSDSTTPTAQPGCQLGNTVRPVVPARQAELVEVAKAMHRGQFGAQVNHLFHWEKQAALSAIQTGLYIGWRCPHYLWDCFRIGDESRCFCGHLLKEHRIISGISVPCGVSQCRCLMFCFIPSRPEEVGEFWLTRRATFNPKAWRAQCRCKHSHEDHLATGSHPCRHQGCCCRFFESNFLCAACDRRWEEHETFFETEEARRRGGRPHGEGQPGGGVCDHSRTYNESHAIKHCHSQRPPQYNFTPHPTLLPISSTSHTCTDSHRQATTLGSWDQRLLGQWEGGWIQP
ncbi:protein FAM221B [Tenrec ecaudatus]|uniref:protein FAM221B n=1 Tax=Tenrec ecaudatus TaxID=94439 RepID=UPI003F597146